MSARIGLVTVSDRCLVCDVQPPAFRDTAREDLVECVRCGLVSQVQLHEETGREAAAPPGSQSYIALLRAYWTDTGRKVSSPHLAELDAECKSRQEAFDQWCQAHPEVMARAQVAEAAPFSAVVAQVVIVEDAQGQPVGLAWHVFAPNGVGAAISLPIEPEIFPVGTIITIQTPVEVRVAAPPEPESRIVTPS